MQAVVFTGRTFYEAWTGNVPNVDYFMEFGSHVLDRKPGNRTYEERTSNEIFVGYSE